MRKKYGDDPNFVCGSLRRFLTAPKGAGDSPEESQLPAEVQAASVLPLSPPPPPTTTTPEGEAGSAQVCNYATHAAAPDEAAQLNITTPTIISNNFYTGSRSRTNSSISTLEN